MKMETQQFIDPGMRQSENLDMRRDPGLGFGEVRVVDQDRFDLVVAFDQTLNQRPAFRYESAAEPR